MKDTKNDLQKDSTKKPFEAPQIQSKDSLKKVTAGASEIVGGDGPTTD